MKEPLTLFGYPVVVVDKLPGVPDGPIVMASFATDKEIREARAIDPRSQLGTHKIILPSSGGFKPTKRFNPDTNVWESA